MQHGTHDCGAHPGLATVRKVIWPEGTCLDDQQLYGDKQQLRRTADIIIKSGVTVSSEREEEEPRRRGAAL
jgi:hypothetical protein